METTATTVAGETAGTTVGETDGTMDGVITTSEATAFTDTTHLEVDITGMADTTHMATVHLATVTAFGTTHTTMVGVGITAGELVGATAGADHLIFSHHQHMLSDLEHL